MLHEIFKGMDNAAEQINGNFEQIEEGLDPVNITSQFTLGAGVTLEVYKVGKVVYLYGSFSPTSGWSDLASTSLNFKGDAPLTSASSLLSDSAKNVIFTITDEGLLRCRAGSAFDGNVIFSGITILE